MQKIYLFIIVLFIFSCISKTKEAISEIQLQEKDSILNIDNISDEAIELKEQGNKFADLQRHQEAIECYTKAIEITPYFVAGYFNRGNSYKSLGLMKEAMRNYDTAININPDYFQAYFNRANTQTDLKDYKGALEDYSKTIELNPAFGDAYINRGVLKYEMGDYEGEIEDYKLCLAMAKETDNKVLIEEVSHNLGRALYDLKRFEEAAGAYSEGIVAAPENGRLYYGRGLSRNQSGDKDGACEDWRKSSALGCFEANVLLPLCE